MDEEDPVLGCRLRAEPFPAPSLAPSGFQSTFTKAKEIQWNTCLELDEPLATFSGLNAWGTVAGDKPQPPFGFPGLLVAISFLFVERPWSWGADLDSFALVS